MSGSAETQYFDGRAVALVMRKKLTQDIMAAESVFGRGPGLAVVLVGEDPASQVYVRNKEKACQSVGIRSMVHRLPASVSTEAVVELVDELNHTVAVDGILVQLPLPLHIDREKVLETLAPEKDVDGLTTINQGRLVQGHAGLRPCTPLGIMDLLKHYEVAVQGKRVAVIGRSLLVGLPVSLMLMESNATVTVIHSKTLDPESASRRADIVVVAAGRAELVNRHWVNRDAIVIDVGIHRTETGLVGDCDMKDLAGYVRGITPVPGGVGPMTIQELLSNTFLAFQRRIETS